MAPTANTATLLKEAFAADPVAGGTSEMFGSLGDMMSTPYASLAVLTAAARALSHVLQTCHWQARGDSFYGDHLLFERLYADMPKEVDALAEKAIGLGLPDLVHPLMQWEHMGHFLTLYVGDGNSQFPRSHDLMRIAYNAEMLFKGFVLLTLETLEKKGELTPGVENLLGGIADKHEEHVYLLSQTLRR